MWLRSLESPPEPLTRNERSTLIAASAVAALTRLPALARTPWDWDELLFMLSLDKFDVARHHPHPPGFPLYILSAKVFRLLGLNDFHALQAVSLLAAMAIVPAMFFLCRELRMPFWQSMSAAVLLAFFPNVWLYGGGAFSDVPSMTLIIAAVALLLAGCRSSRAYFAGAIVLAVSAGFRPQNLAVGLAPFVIASFFRKRQAAVAIVLITIVAGVSYGAAAEITGWSAYRVALQSHRAYILAKDSFLSPARAPLWRVFDDFFVMPYRAPAIAAVLAIAALVALVRRRPAVLIALAAFGPLCIFTWLVLDRYSASRFSIGYAPLFAILAADTLNLLCGAVVIYSVFWTWPALMTVHREISPAVKAVTSIPRGAIAYVQTAMEPFAEWYLPADRLELIGDAPPPAIWPQKAVYLSEDPRGFPRGRVWDIFRHRYFNVSVRPLPQEIAFGAGWYAEERAPAQDWRWMGERSETLLPGGRAHVAVSLYVPLDALATPPAITIRVDGRIIDRFVATQPNLEREWDILGRTLTIETDRVARPANDPRVLGVRLNSIVWTTAA